MRTTLYLPTCMTHSMLTTKKLPSIHLYTIDPLTHLPILQPFPSGNHPRGSWFYVFHIFVYYVPHLSEIIQYEFCYFK